MSEMTVREHNEQLILEKAQMRAAFEQEIAICGAVMAALMGKAKSKIITVEQIEAAIGPFSLQPYSEGGFILSRGEAQAEAA